MTKPKIYKRGSHLSTDAGLFDDDEDTETMTRAQVLKAADERTNLTKDVKSDQVDTASDDSFPASDPPSSGNYT